MEKTTTQNQCKQILYMEKELNSCPRNATETVIMEELLGIFVSEWACCKLLALVVVLDAIQNHSIYYKQ